MSGWTEAEDATLRKLVDDGLSAGLICGQMGRSRNSVVGRAHRLSIRLKGNDTLGRKVRTVAAPSPSPVRRAPWAVSGAERHQETVEPAKLTQPPLAELGEVLFLEAGARRCRYPASEVRPVEAFMVCGERTLDGSSYCLHHYRVSRAPTPARRASPRTMMTNTGGAR